MIPMSYAGAGQRISNARKIKGYSRDELARRTGITARFIYEIEYEKKGFSADVLIRLSEALDVSCDYILKGNSMRTDYEDELLEAIELFDEAHRKKLVRLLYLINDFIREVKIIS